MQKSLYVSDGEFRCLSLIWGAEEGLQERRVGLMTMYAIEPTCNRGSRIVQDTEQKRQNGERRYCLVLMVSIKHQELECKLENY